MNGLQLRPESGLNAWSERGDFLAGLFQNTMVVMPDIYEVWPRKTIVDRVTRTALDIKHNNPEDERSLKRIERTTWVGECAELATLFVLEQYPTLICDHTSVRIPKSSWDIEVFDLQLRLEVKAFPYKSRDWPIKFSELRTFKTPSRHWNSFDLLVQVVYKDSLDGVPFSDGLSFFFWKMIDSSVFSSALGLFSPDGAGMVLDEEAATTANLLRKLS